MAFHCVSIGDPVGEHCTEMVNYCLLFNCLPGLILFHHLFYCSSSKICLDKRWWCTKCLIELQAPLLQVHYSSCGARTKQRDRDKTERRGREESVCVISLRFLLHIFFTSKSQNRSAWGGCAPLNPPSEGALPPVPPLGAPPPDPRFCPPLARILATPMTEREILRPFSEFQTFAI